ncbi:MAG: L,D-transpeptidase [Pseudomonadota bacterium]
MTGHGAAQAGVSVDVSIATQTMEVYVNGRLRHVWRISSGRRGYRTPHGVYRPKRLVRMHYSRKYHFSPMPCSIFFRGGYAIHGTKAVRRLGRPASHGCLRLRTRNACRLYNLVRRFGPRRTRIAIGY